MLCPLIARQPPSASIPVLDCRRSRPFCPHIYLVIRSGVGSGESVYGCASAAALVFLPGAERARVVPPDLGNIGPSSEQDRQLGIVEPIGAKSGGTMSLSACKIWWPGTELNRRGQPFQGCSHPKLSIHSARDNPEFLPVFVLLIGAKMEPSKVTQICLPRFASNRHGFEFASTPSRILAASFDN